MGRRPQDSALRPRLVAQLSKHTKLTADYHASKTLVDLLESLHAIQQRLDAVQTLLDQGRLDDTPRALKDLEQLIKVDTEAWKRESTAYRDMSARFGQLQAVVQERLE